MTVMTALEEGGGPMGLTSIARSSGMSASKAHRYLVSLCRIGLTSQTAAGLYEFGPAMRRLGAESLRRTNEVGVATKHAEDLRDLTGHSVAVAAWGDYAPVVVSWAYGRRPLSLTVRVGASLPLTTSSVGLVFLAHIDAAIIAETLERELAAMDVGQRKQVELRNKATKRDGFAVTTGAVIPGIASVAMPVFAANDPIPLVMSALLPADEASQEHLDAVVEAMRAASSAASAELGSRAPTAR